METRFDRIKNLYDERIKGFVCSRILDKASAEDIIQNIYLSMLQALPKFRGDSDIGTFIFTITERRVTDFLRTRYRDRGLIEKALADTEKLSQKDLVIRQRMMFVARLLTRKEIEVFKLLSRGATNPEIAEKLFIDYDTVRSHMKQLYVKANIRDRVKLVLLGRVLFGTEQSLKDIFTEEIACEFPILGKETKHDIQL